MCGGFVGDLVGDAVDWVGDTVSGIGDTVGSFLEDPFEFTGNVIEGVFDNPLKAATSLGESYLLGDLSWMGDLGDLSSISDVANLSDVVDISDASQLSDFQDFMGGLTDLGEEGYTNFLETLGDQAGDFPTTYQDLLKENELMGAIGDQPGDYDLLGSYGDPLAEGVPEAVKNLFDYNSTTGLSGIAKTVANKVIGSNPAGQAAAKAAAAKKAGTTGGGILDALTSDAGLAALLGGALGYLGREKGTVPKVGYQGGVPQFTAARVPGKGVTYTPKAAAEGGLMNLYEDNTPVLMLSSGGVPEAAKASTPDLESVLLAAQKASQGKSTGAANGIAYLVGRGYDPSDAVQIVASDSDISKLAKGGISDLGSYTHAKGGRMLKGPGDGMSDSIPASIDGKRPARLATDEFVVPADVVSHLGNGSSDAGAKVLYDMMSKVRKARTGSTKQGKQINPQKFVPA